MNIHELNTKAITSPAYVGLDDGNDTYKLDLNAKLSTIQNAISGAESNISTLQDDVEDLQENPVIYHGECSTSASSTTKTVSVIGFDGKEGDLLAVRFVNGNTASSFQMNVSSTGARNTLFFNDTSALEITPNSEILFEVVEVATDTLGYYFVGLYPKEKFEEINSDINDLKGDIDKITSVSTELEDGYISAADGQVKTPTADAEKASGFIPVANGATVKIVVTLTTNKYRSGTILAYDKEKKYITRLTAVEGGSYSTFQINADITDAKIAYIRASFKTFSVLSSFTADVWISTSELAKYVYPNTVGIIQKVDGTHGKNLYDKSGVHSNITKGYYRGYWAGGWSANADYEVVMYDVTPGEKYVVNIANVHVCYFSDVLGKTYINGFLANASNGYTFTIPNNAVTMSISFAIASEDTFQIEYGTVSTAYEAFKWGVKSDNIIGGATVYNVGAGKIYPTIQSAVNVAKNGDIIVIDAGTYNEAVDMVGKDLHLIGAGRDSTIITYSGDDYYYPPLEASRGLVENISFITTATQKAEGAIDTSYCVHIDYDDEANHDLQFINCYFESPIRPTVGIGLRENFTLNFTNCKFKSSVYPVYCHEQQANNKTGQRIELIDCSIQCTGAMSAIHLQESRAYSGNVVTILMQRCIAKANGVSENNIISAATYPNNETPTGSHYLNLDSFYLDAMSALNNESILNAN